MEGRPAPLTPVQQQTLDALGASGAGPRFDPNIGKRLASELVVALGPASNHLPPDEVRVVSKRDLQAVHGCEVRHLAEQDQPFVVTVPIAVGTVAHKAVELGVNWPVEPYPADLVDAALARFTEGDHWLSDFLQTADEATLAELRSVAVDRASAFFECFPPLEAKWRPVTESTQVVELLGGRIRLRGKVDLTLGTARGTEARKVVIDLKTGSPSTVHRDDLRFYALLETIRLGVPPRLTASFYLDQARAETEAVTEGLLDATVARTADGILRLLELESGAAEPRKRTSVACRWCPVLSDCTEGRDFLDVANDTGTAF